jgi:hypothetical protein
VAAGIEPPPESAADEPQAASIKATTSIPHRTPGTVTFRAR